VLNLSTAHNFSLFLSSFILPSGLDSTGSRFLSECWQDSPWTVQWYIKHLQISNHIKENAKLTLDQSDAISFWYFMA